eukprot:5553552-Amphidinium_carterae.1
MDDLFFFWIPFDTSEGAESADRRFVWLPVAAIGCGASTAGERCGCIGVLRCDAWPMCGKAKVPHAN